LDRRRVLLPEVIRQVGVFTVPIRLSRNVTTDVQVVAVDVDAPEGVEAAVQALLAQSAAAEAEATTVTAADEVGGEADTAIADTDIEGVSELGQSSDELATSEAAAPSTETNAADQAEDSAES